MRLHHRQRRLRLQNIKTKIHGRTGNGRIGSCLGKLDVRKYVADQTVFGE